MELFQQIIAATVAGNLDKCAALARKVLDQAVDPFEAIQEGYSKGMQIVGEKFSR